MTDKGKEESKTLIDLLKTEIKLKVWHLAIIFCIGIGLGVLLK